MTACLRRLCEPWCSAKQHESHCRSCKCHCPFCDAESAAEDDKSATPLCTDKHSGCTSFTAVLSCSIPIGEVTNAVPRIVRLWYPDLDTASSDTPLRELCCASCSLPAALHGQVAALPTPRVNPMVDGSGTKTRVGMLMPLRASAFWWGVRFAQSMLACGQQAAHVFLPVLSTATERDEFVSRLAAVLPAAGLRAQLRWLKPLVAAEDARNPPAAKKLRALQAAFASPSLSLSYVVALDAEAEFTSRAPPSGGKLKLAATFFGSTGL